MDNWVLLVLVIIIIYLFAVSSGNSLTRFIGCAGASDAGAGASESTGAGASDASAGTGTGTGAGADSSRETLARRMIAEGIAGAPNDACTFDDMEDGTSDYSEYAMRQTVDARVIESNREFVADRMGNPQTWTGATYTPDRHDTYDAIPWQGLTRPSQVPVNSPTQIPDIDITRNPIGRKFTWSSGETE